MYFSVIIPAYNEEKRLPEILKEIDKYLLLRQIKNYEILVVNDGSKDKTAQIVENLKLQVGNLRLVNNKKNYGKGYVVRQGMLEAKGEYRLFTDVDNSTPFSQIEKILPEFERGFDVVIGSREAPGAVLEPPQGIFRRFIGKGFKVLRKAVIGLWGIEDTQCGFKCFTKRAAEDVFKRAKISRFAFDVEILLLAKKLGYKIKEVPVYWKNDPESKVKLNSIIDMAIDLFKIRWNLILGKYD